MSSTSNAFIAELVQEAASTRRLLERIPEERLSWRPHSKSMSLGEVGMHRAGVPRGIAEFISDEDAGLPSVPMVEAKSVGEILDLLDDSTAFARERIAAWGDEELATEVRMTAGGETVQAMPRAGWIRTLMLNHSYHHPGQLTAYLRLLDVPLPPTYGPTADPTTPRSLRPASLCYAARSL